MIRFFFYLFLMASLFGTSLAKRDDAREEDLPPNKNIPSTTGLTQTIQYVKRHPDWSREKFWEYWETKHAPMILPLAKYFNITRCQQIHVGGMIPPTKANLKAPISEKPVDFDGIAIFLHESADALDAMVAHPYYLQVVAPDERKFIDKGSFGAGIVATYVGPQIAIIDGNQDVWEGKRSRRSKWETAFKEYQKLPHTIPKSEYEKQNESKKGFIGFLRTVRDKVLGTRRKMIAKLRHRWNTMGELIIGGGRHDVSP